LRDGCIRRGGDHQRERGSFGGEFGHPIVTNEDFVAYLCKSDALFSDYFSEDLLGIIIKSLVIDNN